MSAHSDRKQTSRIRKLSLIFVILFGLFATVSGLVSFVHLWLPPAVDLARSLPGVGFGRMHRFEQTLFMAWDNLHRPDFDAEVLDPVSSPSASLSGLWPPPPMSPRLNLPARFENEGIWSSVESRCLTSLSDEGPPEMVRTRLRVDPERPDVDVSFIAMDMRRLALDLVVGRDDGGSGWHDDAQGEHVVAAFNGGFQASHGHFGMRGESKTFIKPLTGAATIAVSMAGRLWLGAWPEEGDASHFEMFRQNLQLLQDGAHVAERLTLRSKGVVEQIGHSPTRRSGICLRGPNTMIYLWTVRGEAKSLGEAMVAVGCQRGMHLDLNAYHTRFEFLNLEDSCSERLEARMSDGPAGRYLQPQRRDFFVLKRRLKRTDGPAIKWDF